MNITKHTKQEDSIESFIALVRNGIETLGTAAEMLCRLHADDPQCIDKIVQKAPQIPVSFLGKMLKVGEKSLHPSLLLNGCPAYHRLSQLPYSAQEQILKVGSVEVVIDANTGDTLRVPLVDLTPAQTTQAITPTGPRTKDDQRAFLKRQLRPVTKATDEDYPWIVKRDKVLVHRPCELNKKDLMRMLSEID